MIRRTLLATLLAAGLLTLAFPPAAAAGPDGDPVAFYECFAGGTTIVIFGKVVAECFGHFLYTSGVEPCGDGGYALYGDGRPVTGCIGG